MGPGQGELRIIVIKCRWRPTRGAVALGTIMTEIVLSMIGIVGSVVITSMARETISGRILIPGAVAGDTLYRSMRSG